jgi:cellulose synthase/poly-beta-1,6-N-acetylglucosamine synthase-like glycosyltransferase
MESSEKKDGSMRSKTGCMERHLEGRDASDHANQVVALIPAHDEAAGIRRAVEGLKAQTFPPTRIIVLVDNCTDDTAAIALSAGAEVFETVGNVHKKAGALNQALRYLLPELSDETLVLVQDADSTLDIPFLENATTTLADPRLGAVGGTFRGCRGAGFVGHLQRNEYARYARDVRRLKGKCLVVTGTAAVLRVCTIRQVSAARVAGIIPAGDRQGGVYDTTVLTEDNELTFAIRHLGYDVLSPTGCTLETEVMTSWHDLWSQRLRWKRGALENCFQYGLTRITWPYWGRQLLALLGVQVTVIYLGTLVWAAATSTFVLSSFWIGVTGIFMVERIITVSDRGWRYMLPAGLMYEVVYDLFLQGVHATAYAAVLFRRERSW